MSQTFQQILELVAQRQVKISVHGYDELAKEATMTRKHATKLVQAGSYVAEVEVELMHDSRFRCMGMMNWQRRQP